MITDANEYYKFLASIQYYKNTDLEYDQTIPKSEKIFSIDLDSRQIEEPNLAHVTSDHRAEVLYFKMPRFYDNMDLARTTGIIQYINANNESRLYLIPCYDITTYSIIDKEEGIDEPMIVFPWVVEDGVTEKAGQVQFSMMFYIMDTDGKNMLYNLNTLPCTLTVQEGLATNQSVSSDLENIDDEKYFDYLKNNFNLDEASYPANLVEMMAGYAKAASENKLTWMVL